MRPTFKSAGIAVSDALIVRARGQPSRRNNRQGRLLARLCARRPGARHRLRHLPAAFSGKFLESGVPAACQYGERRRGRRPGRRAPEATTTSSCRPSAACATSLRRRVEITATPRGDIRVMTRRRSAISFGVEPPDRHPAARGSPRCGSACAIRAAWRRRWPPAASHFHPHDAHHRRAGRRHGRDAGVRHERDTVTRPPATASVSALRGTLIFCRDDPFLTDPSTRLRARAGWPGDLPRRHDRGGRAYAALEAALPPGAAVADHSGCLIAPGFIDTHVHYVQTGIIGAQGQQLLDWLNDYTYPAEQAFADGAVARETAGSSATSCCATAPPLRWCSARSMPARSMRCSRRRKRATCG